MSIERDFLNGIGDFPILFNVSETFQVWDGQVALIVDHLLNHIKVLNDLAEGPVNETVIKVLAQHPHYKLDSKKYLSKATRNAVADTLISECMLLLKCLSQIAPIMDVDAWEQTERLETVREQVPFLDYRYLNEISISDAWRED